MVAKFTLLLASALALTLTASPAIAKNNGNGNGKGNGNGNAPAPTPAPAPAPAGCSATYGTVVNGAIGCQGFFAGNLFSQSNSAEQQAAVAALGGSFNGNFGALTPGSLGGSTVSFGQTLYGVTIVGMHFGNIANPNNLNYGGQGNKNNVSVLWKFDFGTTGANGVTLLATRGWSNAVVYSANRVPAVPEPGTWAMLILGFGVVGGAMRSARKRRPVLNYA